VLWHGLQQFCAMQQKGDFASSVLLLHEVNRRPEIVSPYVPTKCIADIKKMHWEVENNRVNQSIVDFAVLLAC